MMRNEFIREHLVWAIVEGNAHCPFEAAVAEMPFEKQGLVPAGLPRSPWELLEHLRLCQWDILEFSRSAEHVSPEWPDGYWPDSPQPPGPEAWDESVARFLADRAEMVALIEDTERDFLEPFPHGDGQTLLREALLVADHNAYHIGQLVLVRRALGCWTD